LRGIWLPWIVALFAAFTSLASHAGPHEHGVASLELSVDGDSLLVRFSSPLDNLLGWERAPRNEQEQRQYAALREELVQPAVILNIPDVAACRLEKATVSDPYPKPSGSLPLKPPGNPTAMTAVDPPSKAMVDPTSKAMGDPPSKAMVDPTSKAMVDPQAKSSSAPHKDLEAEWNFRCGASAALRLVTVNGFDRFKRLRRVDAVYALPGKSGKSRLTGRQRELKLS
jgi:hypothetical protein